MPPTRAASRPMQTDGTRILVVEDEESLADSVRYNLEREGFASRWPATAAARSSGSGPTRRRS